MNDSTQPEALRLANNIHCGDSACKCSLNLAASELLRLHARIADLEAQLEAVGAGGVNGPLMGIATDMSKEREALRTIGEEQAFEAWFKMDCPVEGANAKIAAMAAPGVGNSGFDHQTAADFLSGKTVSDEAVRKFVAASRWAHDERAALSATLLAMHGVLTSREAEIALLKKALLEAEAAPQQEAQEPTEVPYQKLTNEIDLILSDPDTELSIGAKRALLWMRTWVSVPLYTTPQPAPAPLSEMPHEKRKAIQEGEQISASDAWFKARHEMLDTLDRRNVFRAGFDRGWNAAIAAQGGKA